MQGCFDEHIINVFFNLRVDHIFENGLDELIVSYVCAWSGSYNEIWLNPENAWTRNNLWLPEVALTKSELWGRVQHWMGKDMLRLVKSTYSNLAIFLWHNHHIGHPFWIRNRFMKFTTSSWLISSFTLSLWSGDILLGLCRTNFAWRLLWTLWQAALRFMPDICFMLHAKTNLYFLSRASKSLSSALESSAEI